jgi:2-phospho-L-lactate guanylyltransferase
MIILVPCKHLGAGKSRLSPCLDDEERRRLCGQLLARTLELATSMVGAGRIRVVTADPDAQALAAQRRVSTIADTTGELNSALQRARSQLEQDGFQNGSLMVLPIDLPFATNSSLSEADKQPADIVVAPDEGGTGTNLLLLRSGAWNFPFRFGPNSYARHLSQAQSSGLTLVSLADWRLARDIDSPDQYMAWMRASAPNT